MLLSKDRTIGQLLLAACLEDAQGVQSAAGVGGGAEDALGSLQAKVFDLHLQAGWQVQAGQGTSRKGQQLGMTSGFSDNIPCSLRSRQVISMSGSLGSCG